MVVVVAVCAYVFVPAFLRSMGQPSVLVFVMIGIGWALTTTIFEVFAARQFMDQSWAEVRQMFSFKRDDMVGVLVAVSLVAPLAAASIRGVL